MMRPAGFWPWGVLSPKISFMVTENPLRRSLSGGGSSVVLNVAVISLLSAVAL